MAIISENKQFNTKSEAIAPRIEIAWDPYTNDGAINFHFEELTTQGEKVLKRTFMGVLSASIGDLLKDTYQFTNPMNGELETLPGWKLMVVIKAITDKVYLDSVSPTEQEPDTAPAATDEPYEGDL